MKRKTLLFISLFIFCLTGGMLVSYAQSSCSDADKAVSRAEKILKSYSDCKDADLVSISGALIKLVKPFCPDPTGRKVMGIAKGLMVLDISNESLKRDFNSRISEFISSLGDLKVMEVREEEDNVVVIGTDTRVSGMLVVSDGEAVLMKLSATVQELEELLNNAK